MTRNWLKVIGAQLLMTAISLGLFFGSKELFAATWEKAAIFTGYSSVVIGLIGYAIFRRYTFAVAFLTAGFIAIDSSFASLKTLIPKLPLTFIIAVLSVTAYVGIWKTSQFTALPRWQVLASYMAEVIVLYWIFTAYTYI